jgi:hypothetical protein
MVHGTPVYPSISLLCSVLHEAGLSAMHQQPLSVLWLLFGLLSKTLAADQRAEKSKVAPWPLWVGSLQVGCIPLPGPSSYWFLYFLVVSSLQARQQHCYYSAPGCCINGSNFVQKLPTPD